MTSLNYDLASLEATYTRFSSAYVIALSDPFIFFWCSSLRVPVSPPTATNEVSKRVFLAKEVPFGGLNNEKL